MLTGDELAILLFWVSLAVGAGYEAVSAETYPRRIFFGSMATGFLLIGLFWQQIKGLWPPVTAGVTSIATSPENWFLLFMFAAAIVFFGAPKRSGKALGSTLSNNDDLARGRIDDELAAIRGQIDEGSSNLAAARNSLATTFTNLALDQGKRLDSINDKIGGLEANLTKNNGRLHEIGQESPVVFEIITEMLAHSLLFNGIPAEPELLPISDLTPDNIEHQRTIASEYFEAVRQALSGTQWEYNVRGILQHGSDMADHFVRAIPERPAGIDPLDLRQYAISRIRSEGTGTFVRGERAQARAKYRAWLSLMKQLYDARKSRSQ